MPPIELIWLAMSNITANNNGLPKTSTAQSGPKQALVRHFTAAKIQQQHPVVEHWGLQPYQPCLRLYRSP